MGAIDLANRMVMAPMARNRAGKNNGAADLILIGQPFIAISDLATQCVQAVSLNIPDQASFNGGDEKGYTDYPALQLTAI